MDKVGLVRLGAQCAAALMVIACSPATGLIDDGNMCACPPPPPPPLPPSVIISGVLRPADSTVDVDMVTVFFVSVTGDSTCTPDRGAGLGELGLAVSDSGSFSGTARAWYGAIPACVHLYAKRGQFQYVQLSQRAVRVVFNDTTAVAFSLTGTLPAGPDTWQRHYR